MRVRKRKKRNIDESAQLWQTGKEIKNLLFALPEAGKEAYE